MNCPFTTEEIFAYLEGTLDSDLAAAFEAHHPSCKECSEQLAEIRSYRDTLAKVRRSSYVDIGWSSFDRRVLNKISAFQVDRPTIWYKPILGYAFSFALILLAILFFFFDSDSTVSIHHFESVESLARQDQVKSPKEKTPPPAVIPTIARRDMDAFQVSRALVERGSKTRHIHVKAAKGQLFGVRGDAQQDLSTLGESDIVDYRTFRTGKHSSAAIAFDVNPIEGKNAGPHINLQPSTTINVSTCSKDKITLELRTGEVEAFVNYFDETVKTTSMTILASGVKVVSSRSPKMGIMQFSVMQSDTGSVRVEVNRGTVMVTKGKKTSQVVGAGQALELNNRIKTIISSLPETTTQASKDASPKVMRTADPTGTKATQSPKKVTTDDEEHLGYEEEEIQAQNIEIIHTKEPPRYIPPRVPDPARKGLNLKAIVKRIHKGEYLQTIQKLEKWLSEQPMSVHNEDVIYLTGYCYHRLSREKEALYYFHIYLKRYPNGRWFKKINELMDPPAPRIEDF